MADLESFYRTLLLNEFTARIARNKRYSKRAFAKRLGVDNGYLSKLLSGKILLSLDVAGKMAEKLALSPTDRKEFIVSAMEEQKCHALYLLDPTITDCEPEQHEQNLLPLPRKKKR